MFLWAQSTWKDLEVVIMVCKLLAAHSPDLGEVPGMLREKRERVVLWVHVQIGKKKFTFSPYITFFNFFFVYATSISPRLKICFLHPPSSFIIYSQSSVTFFQFHLFCQFSLSLHVTCTQTHIHTHIPCLSIPLSPTLALTFTKIQ